MFNFLGRLFGSSSAGDAIVEGTVNAVDKLFYTDEEKAEAATAARTEGYAVYMEWMRSTSGSRIARRVIAFLICMPWAFMNMVSVLFACMSFFADPFVKNIPELGTDGKIAMTKIIVDNHDRYMKVSELLFDKAMENNSLVGVVLLFYFGGPAAIDGIKGMVQKWTNGPAKG